MITQKENVFVELSLYTAEGTNLYYQYHYCDACYQADTFPRAASGQGQAQLSHASTYFGNVYNNEKLWIDCGCHDKSSVEKLFQLDVGVTDLPGQVVLSNL